MNSVVVHVWKAGLSIEAIPTPLSLHCLLADVIAEASKNKSEEHRLELPTDQGHRAACVPASVDE